MIVDECSAWSRGIELYNILWQLTREHVLELKPSKALRSFQFEPGISAPPECELRFSHDVFTLGAFVDESPDSIALSTAADSTCPAPAELVQDVAEDILRAWDIEPLTWPQLPDWYGIHVRLTCQHEQHLLATVSFVDSKDDDFIEYGTIGFIDIDFSDDHWSRWRKEVGDYHAVADDLLRRALNDFLVYNTTYFWYRLPQGRLRHVWALTPPQLRGSHCSARRNRRRNHEAISRRNRCIYLLAGISLGTALSAFVSPRFVALL